MNFTQFFLILKARRMIVLSVLLLTAVTTLVVSLLLPKSYTANTTLVVDFKGADPLSGLMLPAQLMPGYMATQTEIIQSQNVALKVVDTLKMVQAPAVREQFADATGGEGDIRHWLADLLMQNLDVRPSREATLINIGYKGTDPQFAATVANAFAQAYIQTNLELRVEPARQTTVWFDTQIKQLRDNVEKAQAKLSAYQKEQGLVASDERIDVETARLAETSTQVVLAQAQTFDTASRQNQSGNALQEVMNNPLIQSLKSDLARSEAKLHEMESKYGKNHPQYVRAEAEVAAMRDKLATEIKTATQTVMTNARVAQQRERELRGALAAQKARVLSIKQKRDELSVLVRDVENAQQLFDQATRRNGQTRLESQTTHTDIAVLNQAVPPMEASSPKIFLNLALSLVLGGFLGVAFGFLMEMIDRRVRSEQDLAGILEIPVLGVLSGGAPKRRLLPWPKWPRMQAA